MTGASSTAAFSGEQRRVTRQGGEPGRVAAYELKQRRETCYANYDAFFL
jgi:hypothetical protein